MKNFRGPLVLTSAAIWSLVAAGCSSKGGEASGGGGGIAASNGGSTGSAVGGLSSSAGGTRSSTGGAKSSTGGAKSSTGGAKSSTGGAASSTGGTNPNVVTACPGLIAAAAADPDAGTSPNVDAGAQCVGVSKEIEKTPIDIYIMMDRSISMTNPLQGTTMTRWDALEQGVQAFINNADVKKDRPRVALNFFSYTGNSLDPAECLPASYKPPDVAMDFIDINGTAILQAIAAERDLLGGQTATYPALEGALQFTQEWQMRPENKIRTSVVVLVTDGYPTECDQDMSHVTALAKSYFFPPAQTLPIRTYVIGVAVDTFNLNAVAQAGGTGAPAIVDSGGVSDFVSAMLNITSSNVSCEFTPPAPPSGQELDPNLVQVVYQPHIGAAQEIPEAKTSANCGGANGGWYFDNPLKPTKITLCPCSCANLAAGIITTRFGCRPQMIIG